MKANLISQIYPLFNNNQMITKKHMSLLSRLYSSYMRVHKKYVEIMSNVCPKAQTDEVLLCEMHR